MKKKKCIICSEEFDGHGHNADPIAIGRCCAICNSQVVSPIRIKIFIEQFGSSYKERRWYDKFISDEIEDKER